MYGFLVVVEEAAFFFSFYGKVITKLSYKLLE